MGTDTVTDAERSLMRGDLMVVISAEKHLSHEFEFFCGHSLDGN